ncbi:MAG: hypothetical protein HYT20_01725 [Candidatus Nealsonbacteria bacterium]|nr:hypothetical protein [Candidatus Nealsonbacteria bacterium]
MPLITVEKTKKYLVLRIPLEDVEQKGQKIVNEAIKEGLRDIETGKTFGPFQNVHEFKQTL